MQAFGCAATRSCFARLRVRLSARSKELQAAASENANWASYYLDYKALKQILGQLTPLESQTEGNAQVRKPARCPCAPAAPVNH